MTTSAENRPQVPVPVQPARRVLQEPGDTWKTPYLTTEPLKDKDGKTIGTELVEVVREEDIAPRTSIPNPYGGPGDDMR